MLNVIWATDIGCEKDWEVDYIKELLDKIGVPYNLVTASRMDEVFPNALIVTNHSVSYMDMFHLYELSETPFGVIHLSDEWFSDDVSFYDFSMCKFAWRNYYDERFDIHPKLNYLALSYKLGFWNGYNGKSPRDITYANREYAWSFAGAPRTNERMATLQMFKDAVLPNKVHFEMGNSFCKPETGLDTKAYRALLLNTQFGLCAVGISKTLSGDTCRVTETLETGGIPIVLAGYNSKNVSYWKSLYNEDPPFIIGNTWEECLKKVNKLIEDPQECERVRLACCDFWQTYKSRISNTLGYHIQYI